MLWYNCERYSSWTFTNNCYQRKQIIPTKLGFTSECIASDGFPPQFLRRNRWTVVLKDMRGKHGRLAHVGGENAENRAQLPPFDFSLLEISPPVVEWYCPFIFINELGTRLKDPKVHLIECPFPWLNNCLQGCEDN